MNNQQILPTKKDVPGEAEEESIDYVPHFAAQGAEINKILGQ